VTDSLRDQTDPAVEEVGLDTMLFDGENDPLAAALSWDKTGGPLYACPCGDWNGLPDDGTDSLRPGVRVPYKLVVRECEEIGECIPEPQRGLLCPVEKVAEVGVLKPGE
jgi:hypothetical protein